MNSTLNDMGLVMHGSLVNSGKDQDNLSIQQQQLLLFLDPI
jgi:hypothetical protein